MELTVVLACVVLVISAAAADRGDRAVACYVDRSAPRLSLRADPSLCTYVILSSATIGDDDFRPLAQDADVGCTSPRALKDRNPALKALLGVEVRQSRLQLLSQNPGSLANFSASALKYLKGRNYDGLELTWVENTISDGLPATTQDLTGLLKELRERIKGDPDATGNQSLLLSVSVLDHSGDNTGPSDMGALSQYVDFISLLPSSLEYEDSQIDRMVKYLQDQGLELQKILLALPVFGRRSRHRRGGNAPGSGDVERKAEQAYGPGLMMAKQVCQVIKSGESEFKTLTKFESAESLGEEVSWLLQKGLGGVGVVVLDVGSFADSLCLNMTESDKAIIESKVITMSPHHPRLCRAHHHHHHHHHHNHGELQQPSHNDSSFDSFSHHRHRHQPHGPHHHGHSHHGHSHHGHGHHGHGYRSHDHHGHGHHGHGLGH